MEPSDIPAVVAIDRASFPDPWPPSSYTYELRHARASYYYVLLEQPDPSKPRSLGAYAASDQEHSDSDSKPAWQRWVGRVRVLSERIGLGSGTNSEHLIGYAGLRVTRQVAHITTIAIHPDWRGEGLGELLVLILMRQSLAVSKNRVTLEVRAANRTAQNLYRKFGFRFTGTHRGYYRNGEDAWLMVADLTTDVQRSRLDWMRERLRKRIPLVGDTLDIEITMIDRQSDADHL
jgi:ribosomal-protein-alanine N-acetyltransferase